MEDKCYLVQTRCSPERERISWIIALIPIEHVKRLVRPRKPNERNTLFGRIRITFSNRNRTWTCKYRTVAAAVRQATPARTQFPLFAIRHIGLSTIMLTLYTCIEEEDDSPSLQPPSHSLLPAPQSRFQRDDLRFVNEVHHPLKCPSYSPPILRSNKTPSCRASAAASSSDTTSWMVPSFTGLREPTTSASTSI